MFNAKNIYLKLKIMLQSNFLQTTDYCCGNGNNVARQ